MSTSPLRVVLADDERPARAFLVALLKDIAGVQVVGEAADGAEALRLIEQTRPDVALLDLQMPEIDGLGVVRLLRRPALPLVIFVTAYDEYAVRAFELNAVDYLLKPVESHRLRDALNRASERLEQHAVRESAATNLSAAAKLYDRTSPAGRLERIPVRHREQIVLVPVAQVASVIADGELLHITTTRKERYTITYRLKDLEARMDPAKFVRLGRGILANVDLIVRITPMPGGTYTVVLNDGQELDVSRIQSRLLRDRLLRL